ncbi:VOC family protein [Actinocrispum wychmicini]|uniref:Glyoxalase/bleomycin resistance protein/dioxygenase superfamily protein n=1 Tax=Actinocrispum wychmicini TaxID=1213861 RepID=A0A4R2J5D4_9PSEU|nr:VOC family protein [Actinocrispum wychmicini]TCO53107.1 glyoxalase/bleomycin resistance protein/dioxygenase superfamily protein [Actinocrispum wychmicini]
MTIRRVVPNVSTEDIEASADFYRGLGFDEAMNIGWVATMASPSNPTAQVGLIGPDPSGLHPAISVEVDDVDSVHEDLVAAGREIVYSLRDEPWGVRRFFVRDPNGTIVNVLTHRA